MRRPHFVLLALALATSTAAAQRGGGGGGGGRTFGKTPDADYGTLRPAGVKLSAGDVEDMNPVKLLVDKRKDLKLTDDQQKQLRTMVDQLKEMNKPNFKVLDSLRTESRPRIDGIAEIEQVRTGIAREQMGGVVETIRGTYAAALKDALAVLDATQQPKADELLKKQAGETDETLREKLGASGGGMAGGRRGRPPL